MLNLDNFVAACRAALAEPSPELAVKEILARALARPSDVEAALGTPQEGRIATLHHDRELTILNVIWAPGMAVFPHDHGMWAVIGLYGGREDNTFYRREAGRLQVAGARQVEGRDTIVLGRNVIHAVTNPLRRFTGAIHIYGGDFFGAPRYEWDPATFEKRPWDADRTRKAFADANARWLADCAAAGRPGSPASP
jgi:predicted metal-dependent enzyme (double-stranded beta helix superfamily)